MTDTRKFCKEAPTTAADHAKKTSAYDKTPNAVLPTSDDGNDLKGMLGAYGEAEQCAQPDDSFNIGRIKISPRSVSFFTQVQKKNRWSSAAYGFAA